MKFTNQTKIYLNVALLFLLTFLFAYRLITSIKTNDYNYLRLAINLAVIALTIYQIVKLSKIENNK